MCKSQSTVGTLLVIRRLQELGREGKIMLCVCFIDVQKAALERNYLFRCALESDRSYRHFHDGKWVRVRLEEANLAVVRSQARATARVMLLPLHFDVSFAAALHAILMRFGEGEGTKANLVYLKQGGLDAETEWIGRFQTAVWVAVRTRGQCRI